MDQKGFQLRIDGRVCALIDRDQKSVYQVEDGDCELVTIIKCVCADGTAIPLSAVFKGTRRNLEWGRNNPCNAREVFEQSSELNNIDIRVVYHTHQKVERTKSWAPHGLSETLSPKQLPK